MEKKGHKITVGEQMLNKLNPYWSLPLTHLGRGACRLILLLQVIHSDRLQLRGVNDYVGLGCEVI